MPQVARAHLSPFPHLTLARRSRGDGVHLAIGVNSPGAGCTEGVFTPRKLLVCRQAMYENDIAGAGADPVDKDGKQLELGAEGGIQDTAIFKMSASVPTRNQLSNWASSNQSV